MKNTDIDPNDVNNVTNWNFGDHEEIKQNLQDGIHCGRTPYCFQCGEIVVEAEYAKDGPDLFSLVKGIVQREMTK